MKPNPNHYYHVFCRLCEFRLVNTTHNKAEKAGLDHYYNMPEDGHNVNWFNSVTPIDKEEQIGGQS